MVSIIPEYLDDPKIALPPPAERLLLKYESNPDTDEPDSIEYECLDLPSIKSTVYGIPNVVVFAIIDELPPIICSIGFGNIE
jgi:hypothetical protein